MKRLISIFLKMFLNPWRSHDVPNREVSHLVEDGFDVYRQVSVRAAEPSHNAEAQARRASLQRDGLIHASAVWTEGKATRCSDSFVCSKDISHVTRTDNA